MAVQRVYQKTPNLAHNFTAAGPQSQPSVHSARKLQYKPMLQLRPRPPQRRRNRLTDHDAFGRMVRLVSAVVVVAVLMVGSGRWSHISAHRNDVMRIDHHSPMWAQAFPTNIHHPSSQGQQLRATHYHQQQHQVKLSQASSIFHSVRNLRGGGRSDRLRRITTICSSDGSHNSSQSPASKQQQRGRISLPLREMIAELTGTFIIVQIGTAAIMSSIFCQNGGLSAGGLYPIAMVWSVAVTIAISCTANISGAHLNPAITIALALFRRSSFHVTKVVPYIVSQFLGAMLASCVNLVLFGSHILQYETTKSIIRSSGNAIPSAKAFGEYFVGISSIQAFFVELFGTFLLSLVIFSLTHPKNNDKSSASRSALIPPFIGVTVAALICTLAPLTQAGFNPARDFGPRIVAYFAGWKSVAFFPYHTSWIVYILGPIIGAILGAAYTDLVLYRPLEESKK